MPRTIYKALTVEDVSNKGEPVQLQRNETVEDWTTPAPKTETIGQPALLKLRKKICFALLPLII